MRSTFWADSLMPRARDWVMAVLIFIAGLLLLSVLADRANAHGEFLYEPGAGNYAPACWGGGGGGGDGGYPSYPYEGYPPDYSSYPYDYPYEYPSYPYEYPSYPYDYPYEYPSYPYEYPSPYPSDPPTAQKSTGGNCPSSVNVGQTSFFTIGYGRAENATIVDNVPSEFDYISSSPSGSYNPGLNRITWSGFTGNGSMTVNFRVRNNVSPTSVANSVTVTNADGEQSSASCIIQIQGGIIIQGDIRAGGQVSRVTVVGPSVVAAGGTINVTASGTIFPIQNYLALRPEWRTTIDANISRLLTERAVTYGSTTLSGGFNINPNGKLGGEVWRRNGILTITGNTTITGRGTIIVESGDLIINGDITYGTSTSLVGFIVRNGTVRFNPGATVVRGAFYVPTGTADFPGGATTLTLSGQVIANRFSFGNRNVTITHDTRLTLLPPPGFISILFPAFKELAP